MDELTIDGKTYVSSKRAAAITGYAKDYVGQLCREGRIEARLVGRSWYVYEPSIRKHRFEEQGEETPKVDEAETDASASGVQEKEVAEEQIPSEKSNIQAVWQTPVYEVEEHSELSLSSGESAPVDSNTAEKSPPEAKDDATSVEEIESAWQSWFKGDAGPAEQTHIYREEGRENAPLEEIEPEEEVPVHLIRPQEERKVEHMDIPRIEEMRPIMPIYAPEEPVIRDTKKQNKAKAANYLALRALLVGIMIIATALAFLGSGLITAVPQNVVRGVPFIQYFEGISSVKKTVE